MEKENLFGKTLEEFSALAEKLKLPSYAGRQLAEWIYQNDITDIDQMTNISKKNRDLLKEYYSIQLNPFSKVKISADGTKKYLFHISENKYVETAYIPENDRSTLCLSTQIGCRMGCVFCMTGRQGFQGNLSSSEILNQFRSLPEREQLTNLVFMGMGEPFDNIDEVMRSLEILTSDWGFGMSPRRITVSTIGIIPAMKIFLDQSQCHLAISLHTPFADERKKMLPVEKLYSITDIIKNVSQYDWSKQRRISFEYIMFRGINDTPRHIIQLSKLLKGMKCRINLIRFHPFPGASLQSTVDGDMVAFRDDLNAKGITATIRKSRGEDIYAACGLLSTKELSSWQNGEALED